MFSALVREEGKLLRYDWSHGEWAGAPDETLAWWRSVVPEPEDGGVSLAPIEALLDTLESLADQPDADRAKSARTMAAPGCTLPPAAGQPPRLSRYTKPN